MIHRLALLTLLTALPLPAVSEEWTTPRMSYGVPDLQGIWTSATLTGLERFDEIEELVLTPEQAHRIESGASHLMDSIDDVPEGELEVGGDVGGYNSAWMDPGNKLAVINGQIRSSILIEPEDGELPYSWRGWLRLAQRFWQLRKTDDPETRLLGERCLVGFGSTGGPPMLPVLYNNNYRIVQSPGLVLILVEMNHNVRTIRMNAEHLPPQIRPWLGDSVGRWEGDTLVVETTRFNPGQSFRASLRHFLYLSTDAVVTERFTRTSSSEILYEFSVDDPSIYTQVWRGELPLRATEGPIYEYACHEGNYSLAHILAGEREKD
ncbi:hypothetical protein MK489_02965 [Myxococcota bacterium]|nr:hypothetical protein [Myxococcota bacterium]